MIAYSLFFVGVWASAVLAIPAALGLFAWLLASVVDHTDHAHTERVVWLSIGISALVAWTILLRLHNFRLEIRAGTFPLPCKADRYPRDEIELRQSVLELRARLGRAPTVVGSGWAHFLWRRGARSPLVFTHEFKGLDEDGRWRAGTTIAHVQKHLKAQGRSLSRHPTMDYISLGAWVAQFNHGNEGDVETPSPIADVVLLDADADAKIGPMPLREARERIERAPGRYVVLTLRLDDAPNDTLQKRIVKVHDEQSAADWLVPGAHLRLLFLGSARDYGLGLRWQAVYDASAHSDPHLCSRFCQFLQVDVCSAVCGWHEPLDRFVSILTRYEANRWLPTIWPFMTLSVVLSGTLNFEIFFTLDEPLNGARLWALVREAIALHQRIGGRSEVRYAKPSRSTIVYWDISLSRGLEQPFLLLQRLGVAQCALHPGKYQTNTAPLERVRVSSYSSRV